MTPDAIQIIRDEHRAVASMLQSLSLLAEQGPGDKPQRFFEVLRAMLFYVDEFPERRHHPHESQYLFPALLRHEPGLKGVIDGLERDHEGGERRVRELSHLLAAWEVLGDTRRAAFVDAVKSYVRFYLQHMRTEEVELLPVAQRVLSAEERRPLDEVFVKHLDPLAGGTQDPVYEALFSRIVQKAPSPIGLGDE